MAVTAAPESNDIDSPTPTEAPTTPSSTASPAEDPTPATTKPTTARKPAARKPSTSARATASKSTTNGTPKPAAPRQPRQRAAADTESTAAAKKRPATPRATPGSNGGSAAQGADAPAEKEVSAQRTPRTRTRTTNGATAKAAASSPNGAKSTRARKPTASAAADGAKADPAVEAPVVAAASEPAIVEVVEPVAPTPAVPDTVTAASDTTVGATDQSVAEAAEPEASPELEPEPEPEPVAAPAPVDKPEPVAEPTPEPEPVTEPTSAPEPESVVEPDATPDPEPVPEAAPAAAAVADESDPVGGPDQHSPRSSTGSALSVRGLSKHFGSKVAVDAIDLEVPVGSFYGIVGPNGAGKTTTLSMATGLLRPDSGTVEVHGIDVWREAERAKRSIGVLPDALRLFDRLTGAQLLYYAGVLRGLDRETVAARSADLVVAFGIEDAVNRLVTDYSAGMTKKIALAAAMIHSPRLLVLDEPFESVDPVSAANLIEILQKYVASGGTVVLSSHGMDFIQRVCDHVAVIVGGHVLASGTMDEVRAGRTLEDRFVELAGGRKAAEGMEWLHSFSD